MVAFSCNIYSRNFFSFHINAHVFSPAQTCYLIYGGGRNSFLFTMVFHSCVPLLGTTVNISFAPMPVVPELVVSSVAVSSTHPIHLGLFLHPCLLPPSKCLPQLLASNCGQKICAVLRILVCTDNLNTALAINTGCSPVPFIQSCLRDLWLYASLFDFEIRALHIPGYTHIIADALSPWDTQPEFSIKFYDAAFLHHNSLSEYLCPFDLFRFDCQW